MKKVALTLASVLAASVFAPEASAVPAFARQVGMACSACHFQHFPLLNGFGRAFKSSGFTMIGAQEKVEGEGLSIPDRLNLAMYTTTAIENESSAAGNSNYGFNLPSAGGEFNMFIAGRGAEFVGFISEAGLQGGAIAAMKIAVLFPVGDARIGAVLHTSEGQGAAYSFETMNTGAAATHKLMGNGGPTNQHVRAFSAAQYFDSNTAATGVSLVANNASGFVNFGLYEQANTTAAGAPALNLNYLRAVYTADIAGFDMGFGIQRFGGESTITSKKNDLTIIDAQAQGEVGSMPLGVYVSYGTAAASDVATATNTAPNVNTFNSDTANTRTSLNVAATLEFAHATTVQGAIRSANTAGLTDNAVMIGATYDLAQNVALGVNYTTQSGDAWTVDTGGKNATTFLFEALF